MEYIDIINMFAENEKLRKKNITNIIAGYNELLQNIAVELWNNDKNDLKSTFKVIDKEFIILTYMFKSYNDIKPDFYLIDKSYNIYTINKVNNLSGKALYYYFKKIYDFMHINLIKEIKNKNNSRNLLLKKIGGIIK